MGEMICLCREINKSTGEIAVYPLKAEVTDRLLFCLGLRQRVNPELKYFVTLAANYDANEGTSGAATVREHGSYLRISAGQQRNAGT